VASLYPIEHLPIIGFSAIPRRLPKILRLMRFTAKAVVAKRPHVLVVIDSPGFTRGIARRGRGPAPPIPTVRNVRTLGRGLAPGARVGDASLYRSHPGVVAFRACGPPAAGRAALHLCGPSAGGTGAQSAPQFRGGASPVGHAADPAGAAREQDQRDRATAWGFFRRR